MVSLNVGKLMQQTIDSALRQTFTDYEIIVKDGLSKDNTLDFVPASEQIRVFAEQDSSIYDAMNQGVRYSKGKYLIFMNCGDVFASDRVLEQVRDAIGESRPAMIYGDYTRDGIVHHQPTAMTPFYLYRTPLCHQTIFFDGELMRSGHLYDTQYRILADHNLELQLMNEQRSIAHCDVCVCDYEGGGVSESEKGIVLKNRERKQILERQFSKKDRLRFELRLRATLPGLRKKLTASDKTPRWVKKLYQKLVNSVNN